MDTPQNRLVYTAVLLSGVRLEFALFHVSFIPSSFVFLFITFFSIVTYFVGTMIEYLPLLTRMFTLSYVP
jgi:hypothetical protein